MDAAFVVRIGDFDFLDDALRKAWAAIGIRPEISDVVFHPAYDGVAQR